MVFQWFYHPLTITIECLFTDQPLKSMVFRWFFPNLGAMVSDGFDLEKDLKMRIIVTDPILQQLYVLLASQSDAHRIAPHRDPNPSQSHTQSTYSSGARKTHDVIYF